MASYESTDLTQADSLQRKWWCRAPYSHLFYEFYMAKNRRNFMEPFHC